MAYSESSRDTEIVSVIIVDELGETLIDFSEQITSGKVSIGVLEFVESLAETSIRGSISVDTTKGEFDKLQLVGNEFIQFVLKTPAANEDEEDFIIVSPEFKIYDFDESTDFTDVTLLPEGVRPRALSIRFASKQESSVFDTKNPLPYGFVGKIANTMSITGGAFAEDIDFLALEEESDTTCPGLINELALIHFAGEDFEIEKTDNSVMLSPTRFSFPTRKITRNMNLLQLINYATKYAWKSDNVVDSDKKSETNNDTIPFSKYGWCNYFFWQDLNGWHFKSATKMVEDSYKKGIKTFAFSQDLLSPNRIYKLDTVSDFSIAKAFSDGLLFSYYKRIHPNYSDIYARFLDDDKKYVEEEYTYNYATDYLPLLNGLRFLPDTIYDPLDGEEKQLEDWIVNRKNNELKYEDRLFGYYDNRQHRDKKKLNRIIGRGYDVDSTDYSSNIIDENSGLELADYNLYQDNMWQEMFDCVDIMSEYSDGNTGELLDDCGVLRKIKEIKKETYLAKNKYKRALQYKEKWNVYKYSICCDGTDDVNNDFFAVIKNHQKIGDNIFRYEWAEVSIIPKAELGFVVGFGYTADEEKTNEEIYSAEIFGDTGINAFELYDPDEKISYVPHIDPGNQYSVVSRFGFLSGTFYFKRKNVEGQEQASDDIMDGVTGSISWDYVKHLFKGDTPEGITLTFHNSHYSPFLIVEKENAARGTTGNYSGAYNLNEIMNRKIYEEETYPENSQNGASADIIYYQTSELNNSPVGNIYANTSFDEPVSTLEEDHLVGPGINANSNTTEYPDAFDMMPIGAYKKSTTESNVECSATAFGHVVRMSSVSYDDLLNVGIEPRNFPVEAKNKRFFYFSAENAHDGNCTGQCEL